MIQEGVLKRVADGWYSFHDWLPYVPFRNIPRGSTPRKDDPQNLNPRPTSEFGAPRVDIIDSSGEPVIDVNSASKGLPVEHKWHKEWKPRLQHVMRSVAVLLHLAAKAKQCVFFITDDMKVMFNQLKLAPESYWYSATLFRNPECGEAAWAAEYVLPFGAQAASNICQAWAHAIMKLVRDLFDKMEAANPDEDPFVTQWVVDRKELGVLTGNVEHRLAVAECYTDDSFAAIIGVARTIRYTPTWMPGDMVGSNHADWSWACDGQCPEKAAR